MITVPRASLLSAVALALLVPAVDAIDLELSASQIEAALQTARGSEAGRSAFHSPYLFNAVSDLVERIEVITELRRAVVMAEERMALGDRMFAQSTSSVQQALRPFRRRVSIIATINLPQPNAYILAPPLDIALQSGGGDVPRLDFKGDTLFALGAANQQLPVIGARAEATYDATAIATVSRLAIVRMAGKEVGGVTIDFARLE